MNYLSLLTLALAIAMPAVEATKCIPAIPGGASKTTVCSTLSRGGLVNLAALGCSDVNISPSVSILKRNAEARRSLALTERTTNQDFCKALSFGGLINLALLGCSDVTVSPDIDVLRRTVSHKEKFCKAFSAGGLLNLALLGCADVEVSPTVDVLRKRMDLCARFADEGLHARGLGCEGSHLEARSIENVERSFTACSALSKAGLLNLSLLGCSDVDVSPDVDILKRGECHNTPHHPKPSPTKHTTKAHPPKHTTKTHPPKHTTKTHPPKHTPTARPPTHTPKPQPAPCAVNVKEVCKSMSGAGLINLDVLGCAKVNVSPTIKVGQNLLGTVDNVVDNVGDLLGNLLGGGNRNH